MATDRTESFTLSGYPTRFPAGQHVDGSGVVVPVPWAGPSSTADTGPVRRGGQQLGARGHLLGAQHLALNIYLALNMYHEGWTTGVYPDGRVSVGSTGTGEIVRPLDARGRVDHDAAEEIVDGRTSLGWRAQCDCGWHGELWRRVDDPADHDPAARQVADPPRSITRTDGTTIDPRIWGSPPEDLEERTRAEWRAHLEPDSIGAVGRTAVADAQRALDRAVADARADGRSWTEIGQAAGMTRQSAHERWANR